MSRWDADTKPASPLPTVLVVGCSQEFVERCAACARGAGGIARRTTVVQAAEHVARWRPFVIVVLSDVYELDREGFDRLVKDVGAELVTLSSERPPGDLLEALIPLALATASRRRTESKGPG